MQLLLVRLRHDRRRPRRQAHHDGGRLRPHREPRVAVRQRHFDVRDAHLAEAAHDAPLPGAGQRPLGGHLAGERRGRARSRRKIRKTRDETWIATEKVGDKEVPVNRTDAIGFLGGAQNTNEECYLFHKVGPGCSAWLTSSTRPDFDTAPRSPVWGPHSGGFSVSRIACESVV